MSEIPVGWATPNTTWASVDAPTEVDMNRIEGNAAATETGDRTIDQAQAPVSSVGTLREFLHWFANRIKAITGGTNWYDVPGTTLAAAATHAANTSNPHSVTLTQLGLESIVGGARVNGYQNLGGAL